MNCDSCNNFCTDKCNNCRKNINGEVAYSNYEDDTTVNNTKGIDVETQFSEETIESSENTDVDDTIIVAAKNVVDEIAERAAVKSEVEKEIEQSNADVSDSIVAKMETTEKEFDIGIGAIFNENCNDTMDKHIQEHSVDCVLTSPPYCTSNRAGKKSTVNLKTSNSKYYPYLRYDVFSDNMSPEEYVKWTVGLFNRFDRILKKNGCILYNISYSSDNRDMMFLVIADIIRNTNFSMMDMIGWKKHNALPNNISPNKLTRIFEPVFVFARKTEIDTFICNKKVVSTRERTGQRVYENIFNFIDARNNDGVCKLNRATYSSELCEKLLNIYVKNGMTVYDPFMGTGTTAVACKRLGMKCFGSEISEDQCKYATDRILNDCELSLLNADKSKNEER